MTLSVVRELEKLVSFNTVNDGKDKKASSECPRYIGSKLEEFGFISEVIESNGFYTSFARRGQGKSKILFLAHHDVVPVGDAWDSDPFKLKVEGDRAYGRGTCDDKGNIVSMLLLAEKLVESDLPCSV
ncbi:MAG: M20/M25/M40 family metallo-hydrolase, partial [Candidatus Thorarchaeota archaeon]|nr:M20/M25/M40 family metallo-hydrolase [Candidatus Thorarchaeota archaeon]